MIVLVLGGARSGKSAVAEALATKHAEQAGDKDSVTYIATAPVDRVADDPDFAERVAVHRRRRPANWATVEAGPGPALATTLAALEGTVLLDSLGTWVAATTDFAVDATVLVDVLRNRSGTTIVVSEEVGLGVHPSTEIGRHFRDALGTVNQAVASAADDAFLAIAGRVLPLPKATSI